MKKMLVALAFVAIAICAHGQELIVIESENLHCNDSVLVFKPSNPNGAALYLLHGFSGCYRDWSRRCDVQKFADESGFLIICPDGFYSSWYLNNVTEENGMQWRTFFDKELYPLIQQKFSLDPEKTFITGLSMGGMGAINIFLDDVSRFKAAGSMSGVLDIHATSLTNKWISKILGPYEEDNYKIYNENSAINRIENAVGSGKMMLISCGYSDSLAECSEAFAQRCKTLKVPHAFVFTPGVHSWKYWDFALDLHLWYFTKILNGENLGF